MGSKNNKTKKEYILLDFCITKVNGDLISNDECEKFWDDVIEVVEKHKMAAGGSCIIADFDENTEEFY